MPRNVQTQSGNRVVVEFDGVQFGSLQSVSFADDYAPEPASGIGDIHAFEHVPTMARHTINVSTMVLNRNNMRQLGLIPPNGDAMLEGIVFDIVEISKDTNSVLRKYMGCSYASGNMDVSKHAIVMSSAVFNCLDVSGIGA